MKYNEIKRGVLKNSNFSYPDSTQQSAKNALAFIKKHEMSIRDQMNLKPYDQNERLFNQKLLVSKCRPFQMAVDKSGALRIVFSSRTGKLNDILRIMRSTLQGEGLRYEIMQCEDDLINCTFRVLIGEDTRGKRARH